MLRLFVVLRPLWAVTITVFIRFSGLKSLGRKEAADRSSPRLHTGRRVRRFPGHTQPGADAPKHSDSDGSRRLTN